MIANIAVITDNLDYLLWGRLADGQPGGVLLTLDDPSGARPPTGKKAATPPVPVQESPA
ncbi:Uncharacterised protein [Citrobacter amalonaticus]|uniref:Uncharacterized protein n=1 Tax=Citrobacter amalonaticus TaxID=35703 RepID=A0A6N2VE14_CITAM